MDERKLQALRFADGDLGKAMRIYEWLCEKPEPKTGETFDPREMTAYEAEREKRLLHQAETRSFQPFQEPQQRITPPTGIEVPEGETFGDFGAAVASIPMEGIPNGGEGERPLASPSTPGETDLSARSGSLPVSEIIETTGEPDLSISLDTGEASPFVSDGETDTPVQEEPTRFRESNWRDEIRAAGRAARARGKPRWFNPYANGRGGNAEASDLWLGGFDEQAASESANAVKEEA